MVPEILVRPTNHCSWYTPWWWHFGAEIWRSWQV